MAAIPYLVHWHSSIYKIAMLSLRTLNAASCIMMHVEVVALGLVNAWCAIVIHCMVRNNLTALVAVYPSLVTSVIRRSLVRSSLAWTVHHWPWERIVYYTWIIEVWLRISRVIRGTSVVQWAIVSWCWSTCMFPHFTVYVLDLVKHLLVNRAVNRIVWNHSSPSSFIHIWVASSISWSSWCHNVASSCALRLKDNFRLRTFYIYGDYQILLGGIVDRVHAYILVACFQGIITSERQHHRLLRLLLNIAVSEGSLHCYLFFIGVLIYSKCSSLLPSENSRIRGRIINQCVPTLLLIIDCVCEVAYQRKFHGGVNDIWVWRCLHIIFVISILVSVIIIIVYSRL